jgi:hypothetical protein
LHADPPPDARDRSLGISARARSLVPAAQPIRRWSVCLICALTGVLAGCGGSGSKSAAGGASGAVSPARHAAACADVVVAEKRYLKATGEMGLAVLDKRLERRSRAATEAFERTLAELQRSSTTSDAAQIARLAASLSLQTKMFRAFEAHKLGEAARYGNQVNAPLRQALNRLPKTCPSAPPVK